MPSALSVVDADPACEIVPFARVHANSIGPDLEMPASAFEAVHWWLDGHWRLRQSSRQVSLPKRDAVALALGHCLPDVLKIAHLFRKRY